MKKRVYSNKFITNKEKPLMEILGWFSWGVLFIWLILRIIEMAIGITY